jgi:hypothetical protein
MELSFLTIFNFDFISFVVVEGSSFFTNDNTFSQTPSFTLLCHDSHDILCGDGDCDRGSANCRPPLHIICFGAHVFCGILHDRVSSQATSLFDLTFRHGAGAKRVYCLLTGIVNSEITLNCFSAYLSG